MSLPPLPPLPAVTDWGCSPRRCLSRRARDCCSPAEERFADAARRRCAAPELISSRMGLARATRQPHPVQRFELLSDTRLGEHPVVAGEHRAREGARRRSLSMCAPWHVRLRCGPQRPPPRAICRPGRMPARSVEIDISRLGPTARDRVRDTCTTRDGHLSIVATDRLSAFDAVDSDFRNLSRAGVWCRLACSVSGSRTAKAPRRPRASTGRRSSGSRTAPGSSGNASPGPRVSVEFVRFCDVGSRCPGERRHSALYLPLFARAGRLRSLERHAFAVHLWTVEAALNDLPNSPARAEYAQEPCFRRSPPPLRSLRYPANTLLRGCGMIEAE